MLTLDAHTCDCVHPRRKNSEHTHDSFRGKRSMTVPSFFTATAYRSEEFLGSLCTPTPFQPSLPIHFYIRGSRECNFFKKTFPWQLLSSSRLLCCKIFVLKYFRRTSTLRKIFNTKIFPMKTSYNKSFLIYGNILAAVLGSLMGNHVFSTHFKRWVWSKKRIALWQQYKN